MYRISGWSGIEPREITRKQAEEVIRDRYNPTIRKIRIATSSLLVGLGLLAVSEEVVNLSQRKLENNNLIAIKYDSPEFKSHTERLNQISHTEIRNMLSYAAGMMFVGFVGGYFTRNEQKDRDKLL